MKTAIFAATPIAAILLTGSAQAVDVFWNGGSGNWSVATNWVGGDVPDTSAEVAFFGGVGDSINMDASFTAGGLHAGFGAQGLNTHSGPGTLTINGNANNVLGFAARAGGTGDTLLLNGNYAVNNTGGNFLTFVRNDNAANTVEFGTGSTLTLNSLLLTHPGFAGSTIEFNGTLAPSLAALRIGGANVSFNAGHDSSAFGQDLAFQSVASGVPKLAVNGGTVLASGRKLQVNASGELELNGANAWNGANIVLGAANDLLLDVNANQMTMGTITLGTGILTLDIADLGVGEELWFADSSAFTWDGTVAVVGFQENVIKFGTDASGLTTAQLGAITGTYGLTETGYLTVIPEPTTLGLLLFSAMGLAVRRKRA